MKALLIVDMLNDFVQENGALPVKGAIDIVDRIKFLKKRAESHSTSVIYGNDKHEKGDRELETWGEHCMKGTYGAQVVDDLKPGLEDFVFEKHELSIFSNDKFKGFLKKWPVLDEIYIVGVATDYCVRAAALDAAALGYKVKVVVDAIVGVELKDGDCAKALIEMGLAGCKPKYTSEALEEMLR